MRADLSSGFYLPLATVAVLVHAYCDGMDESVMGEVELLMPSDDRNDRQWSDMLSMKDDEGYFRWAAGSIASHSEPLSCPPSDSHCFSRAD